jgi:trimethylamine-N-oxide reductase (cytochrome c)
MPPRIPCARIADMLLNPGAEIDFNGRSITYPDIRMILWAGGNPLSHHQDRNKLIRAWQQPEVIVVQEPWWTTTARFADIVLPATTPFERNDIEICGDYSRQFVVPMHQLVAPQDEARNDYDIAADLADRLGYSEGFGRKPEMAHLQEFYEVCASQAARVGEEMPDFATFWESGGYHEFPVEDAARQRVRHADFRDDPDIEALGTPSGRIELYSRTVAGFGYEGIVGHAKWIPPTEWLGGENADGLLHLISQHPEYRIHSQMNSADVRALYTVQGREPIEISTVDAEARGIADGDVVRVFNERGQTLAGAVVTDALMPGVVRLAQGSWYDPDRPGEIGALDKYGSANQVTRDLPSSKIGQATTAHTALVQIEKFAGPLPTVTAFDPPPMG